MASFRQSRGWIAVAAVAVMVSWLLASNHCAAMALSTQPDPHQCCHQDPAAETQGCCQSLSAPLPVSLKATAAPTGFLAPWDLTEPEPLVVRPSTPSLSARHVLTNSPPGVASFAEQVLSGILAAHAPPRIAG